MKVHILTLEIDGRKFTYSALSGDRDPMEMTLAEWRSAPLLTALAMTALRAKQEGNQS